MKLWQNFQNELRDSLGDENLWAIKDRLTKEHELFKHFSIAEIDIVWRRFSNARLANYLVIDDETIREFIDWLNDESF